jgi:hypothetical protein
MKIFHYTLLDLNPLSQKDFILNNSFISWGCVCPRIMANELIIYTFNLNSAVLQSLDVINYIPISFNELLEIYKNINHKDIKLVELLQLIIAKWDDWN